MSYKKEYGKQSKKLMSYDEALNTYQGRKGYHLGKMFWKNGVAWCYVYKDLSTSKQYTNKPYRIQNFKKKKRIVNNWKNKYYGYRFKKSNNWKWFDKGQKYISKKYRKKGLRDSFT